MKITIKKNRHYPWLLPIGLPLRVRKYCETTIKAKFKFTDSCMYDLHDEDQWDVNKLFGFSIGHHHKTNSFRFGWRPKLNNNTIEIVAYEYINGVREKTEIIGEVELNKWHVFELHYNPQTYRRLYILNHINKLKHSTIYKPYGFGYTLGVYFGGNEKAPHNITIFKKK